MHRRCTSYRKDLPLLLPRKFARMESCSAPGDMATKATKRSVALTCRLTDYIGPRWSAPVGISLSCQSMLYSTTVEYSMI